ncbi:hypothetical protein CP49_26560, partial [Bradyrhizobium valentinum]
GWPATGAGGALTTGGRGAVVFFAGGRRGSRPLFGWITGAVGAVASGIGNCPSAGSTIGGGIGGGG